MTPDETPVHAKGECYACGAPILFAHIQGKRGIGAKPSPFDPSPATGGTYRMEKSAISPNGVRAVYVEAHLSFGRQDLHVSHWSTCPKAEQVRADARAARARQKRRPTWRP